MPSNSGGLHFNLHHLQSKKVTRASGVMVFSRSSCVFFLLFAECRGMISFLVCYNPFDREFYFIFLSSLATVGGDGDDKQPVTRRRQAKRDCA